MVIRLKEDSFKRMNKYNNDACFNKGAIVLGKGEWKATDPY